MRKTTTMRAANDILAKITSDDILLEILSCLPVKSLLRFRYMSKTWLSLISSPHFVKLQLNRSIQVNPKILFSTAYGDTYTIDYQTECYDPKVFDFPVNYEFISACCNGLLCLSDANHYMTLCNPSTEEYVEIPYDESLDEDVKRKVVVGFGFDPVLEQYKIVSNAGIIQIWMMKDYGVKESWTKLFSVGMPSADIEFSTIEPLVLCGNGEMILKSGGELYIYNNGIDHTLAATYTIYEDSSFCYAGDVYEESLISIESLVHPEAP